jgi:serine acetyltransferase
VLDRLVGSIIDIGIGVKIINGMTLGGAKKIIVLKKDLDVGSILRSTINIGKEVKITDGMTLGGAKEPM